MSRSTEKQINIPLFTSVMLVAEMICLSLTCEIIVDIGQIKMGHPNFLEGVMSSNTKPIANSMVVLREEFDDWAVLFDLDTGNSFGLNPVSVFIFKRLDGKHSLDDIIKELRVECKNAPDDAEKYVRNFIEDLVNKGLAGYEF